MIRARPIIVENTNPLLHISYLGLPAPSNKVHVTVQLNHGDGIVLSESFSVEVGIATTRRTTSPRSASH